MNRKPSDIDTNPSSDDDWFAALLRMEDVSKVIGSDLKTAYAEGKASEEERELVEAAMELNPRLKSEVLELQETVRFIASPEAANLIASVRGKSTTSFHLGDQIRTMLALPSLLFGSGTAVTTAVLMFVFFRAGSKPHSIYNPIEPGTKLITPVEQAQIDADRQKRVELEKKNQELSKLAQLEREDKIKQKAKYERLLAEAKRNTPVQMASVAVSDLKFYKLNMNTKETTKRGNGGDKLPLMSGIFPIETKFTSDTPVIFQWNASNNASSYVITVDSRKNDSFGGKISDVEMPNGKPTWAIGSLKPGETYSWSVTALDSSGALIARTKTYYFSILSEKEQKQLDSLAATDALSKIVQYFNRGLCLQAQEMSAKYLKYHPTDQKAKEFDKRIKELWHPQT